MRLWKLTLVASFVVVALAGCLRFDAKLTLTPDDTVSGTFVVAVKEGTGEKYGSSDRAMAEDIWADYPTAKALADATISGFRGDGYVGISVRFNDVPLTAFAPTSTAWGITHTGDEFVVSGPSDATSSASSSGDDLGAFSGDLSQLADAHLTVAITFPGPVASTNGAINGKTVTWNLVDGPANLEARGSAVAQADPALGVAYAAFAILALGGGAYALAGRLARRHRSQR